MQGNSANHFRNAWNAVSVALEAPIKASFVTIAVRSGKAEKSISAHIVRFVSIN